MTILKKWVIYMCKACRRCKLKRKQACDLFRNQLLAFLIHRDTRIASKPGATCVNAAPGGGIFWDTSKNR